ncbi:zinc finger MYM-type protein 1-like [Dendronephthya gigantea]|uniref:zinc finger MYM-type protein 1-like n=1 Tax=Dendronephthya gigantea TaxID=151771 RepID=UPI00106D01D7|nr:zinc finger MYM-type protein 1-like [Dendronephthya gigantea]
MLMKLLSFHKLFLRQGVAIRGHTEEEGNLYQDLKCRCEGVPGLEAWLRKGEYRSHDIINELIELMCMKVLRELLAEIRDAECYSIIADETRDLSGAEQFSVSIRWVDSEYNISEDLIGMVEVENTTAEVLTSVIKDTLLRCVLPLSQCRGQAYDGAANMAGCISGVAKRLQEDEPSALFVHCLAHNLNLCLQDCGRQCDAVKEALNLTSGVATIIRASPKRFAIFRHLQEEFNMDASGLKPLCPTRWTVRTGAINAILKNYEIICNELEQVSKDSGPSASNASGYVALMERFQTFFGLRLSYLVFSATEQLSRTLQGHDLNAQDAAMAVSQAVSFLTRQRSDAAFSEFFQATVSKSKNLTEPPKLRRPKSIPKRLDDGSANHTFTSPESFFRHQYFEVLDLVINEMRRRFNQPSFAILKEIESLLLKSCSGVTTQPSESLSALYAKDLDLDRLKVQLCMLPDLVRLRM